MTAAAANVKRRDYFSGRDRDMLATEVQPCVPRALVSLYVAEDMASEIVDNVWSAVQDNLGGEVGVA